QQHRLSSSRLTALGQHLLVSLLVLPLRDDLARQEGCVAGRVDANLTHHLSDDHLDVLVVDVNALRPVDLLNLVDQEGLHGLLAQHVQQLLGAYRALGDLLPCLDGDRAPVAPLQLRPDADTVWDRVLANLFVHRRDADLLLAHLRLPSVPGAQDGGVTVPCELLAFHHFAAVLDQDLHPRLQRVGDLELFPRTPPALAAGFLADPLQVAVDLRDDGLALRNPSLEQLLDPRQTLGDVHSGNTAGVERPHGELGSRLTNRLG